MKRCLKFKVSGSVQVVAYRAFIQEHAKRLEIEGTVQNGDDGSVVICACGTAESLDDLIDLLYQGVESAKALEVAAESLGSPKDFRGVFRVIGGE